MRNWDSQVSRPDIKLYPTSYPLRKVCSHSVHSQGPANFMNRKSWISPRIVEGCSECYHGSRSRLTDSCDCCARRISRRSGVAGLFGAHRPRKLNMNLAH